MYRQVIVGALLMTAPLLAAGPVAAQLAQSPKRLAPNVALIASAPAEARASATSFGRQRQASKEKPAARRQRPDQRMLSVVQEAPCAQFIRGRCIGRDPDPTVRFMIRHDSSMVND